MDPCIPCGEAGITMTANVALNVFTNYVNKIAQTEIDFPRVLSGELT